MGIRKLVILGVGGACTLLAGCTSPIRSDEVSTPASNQAADAPLSADGAVAQSSVVDATQLNRVTDWVKVSALIGSANDGDAFMASSPRELAANSDWVFTAVIYDAGLSRSFATSSSPEEVKYQTFGFMVRDVERVGGTSKEQLPSEVVLEVIAPRGAQLEDTLKLLEGFTPARVIVFGNDFSDPDPKTTVVYGGDARATYVAPHAQGLAVEVEGQLLSVADGLGSYLTDEYGLKSIDDALAWLRSYPSTDNG